MAKKKTAKSLSPEERIKAAVLVEILDHIDRAYQLCLSIEFRMLSGILAAVGHSLMASDAGPLKRLHRAIEPWVEEELGPGTMDVEIDCDEMPAGEAIH